MRNRTADPCLTDNMRMRYLPSSRHDRSRSRQLPRAARFRRWPLVLLVVVAQIVLVERVAAAGADNRRETTVKVPAGGASVPMLDIGGRPVVEVTINGRGPYPFILDTGATDTVIDSGLSSELGLPSSGDGSRLEELVIGSMKLTRVNAAAGPISAMFGKVENPPRGVLSALSFPGYLLTFDYPRKTIAIRKGALPPANGKTVFSYGTDERLPTVPVNIAGVPAKVHLDTGAPFVVSLPTKYKDQVPLTAPAEEKGKARSHSGEFPVFKGVLKGAIALGEYELSTREIMFTDVVPHGGAIPQGQIGYGALRDFAVTLDSANRRVEFAKAAAAAAGAP